MKRLERLRECLEEIEDRVEAVDQGTREILMMPEALSEEESVRSLRGEDTHVTKRLRTLCGQAGMTHFQFVRAPKHYYTWSLSRRARFLRAPSESCLCKSVIMTNNRCRRQDWADPTNSKYYLVIVQYEAKLNKELLIKVVQQLGNHGLGKKQYSFRLASEEDNDRLSGFEHNAVTPIGMKEDVPIILDQRIVDTVEYMWMGGGEVDVKWAVAVSDFIQAKKPFIGPVSVLRQ